MKEDVTLPCLLGCSCGEDSLNHYVQCSHLFAFCKYLFNADACPLIRLGIKCPTTLNLKIVSCVFSAYHALKAQVRDGRISMQENTRTFRINWSVFADALAAEAGECHISFVAFSLPKFVSFLTNQSQHIIICNETVPPSGLRSDISDPITDGAASASFLTDS